MFQFVPATRRKAKARVCLTGPDKSGKTYTALTIGAGLLEEIGGGNMAVIDTENQSASKYAGDFAFDVCELDRYDPLTYVSAIAAAEDAGYDVIIVDSATHAWAGKGGILERVSSLKGKGNDFAAWGKVTPDINAFLDSIVRCKAHLIVTVRSKIKYELQPNEKGKLEPVKLGVQPIQRDGFEYEFDVTGDMDRDHNLRITGSRCAALDGLEAYKPGRDIGRILGAWLMEGQEACEGRDLASEEMGQFMDAAARVEADFVLSADDRREVEAARLLALKSGYMREALRRLRTLYARLLNKQGSPPKATPAEPASSTSPAPAPRDTSRERVEELMNEIEPRVAELDIDQRDSWELACLRHDEGDHEGAIDLLEKIRPKRRNGEPEDLRELRSKVLRAYVGARKANRSFAASVMQSRGWSEIKDVQACADREALEGAMAELGAIGGA